MNGYKFSDYKLETMKLLAIETSCDETAMAVFDIEGLISGKATANEALLVDLHKYTDTIITQLLQDSPVREETITTINEVSASLLPIEPGAPLAIALYELLENSIQHAFKEEALANYIHISFTNEYLTEQSAFRYCLTVQDNGRGLPDDVDPQARETAGMAILHTMAERLAGSLNFNSKDGTSISLTFTYKERL